VEKNSIGQLSINLWKVPASWSAWQWVNINLSIRLGSIPSLYKARLAYGGGSIIIPLPFIHKTNPLVESQVSNP